MRERDGERAVEIAHCGGGMVAEENKEEKEFVARTTKGRLKKTKEDLNEDHEREFEEDEERLKRGPRKGG